MDINESEEQAESEGNTETTGVKEEPTPTEMVKEMGRVAFMKRLSENCRFNILFRDLLSFYSAFAACAIAESCVHCCEDGCF